MPLGHPLTYQKKKIICLFVTLMMLELFLFSISRVFANFGRAFLVKSSVFMCAYVPDCL